MIIDFTEDPLLAVYGDSKTGKSTLVRHLMREVLARRAGDPSRSILMVCDVKRRLSAETHLLIEGEDYYETDPGSIAERLMALDALLRQRTPPRDLGWQAKRDWSFDGPVVYLFIDDLDVVPAQVQIQQHTATGDAPAPCRASR